MTHSPITKKQLADTIRHDANKAREQWLAIRKDLAEFLQNPRAASLQWGGQLQEVIETEAAWYMWAQIPKILFNHTGHPCSVPPVDLDAFSHNDVIAAARDAVKRAGDILDDGELSFGGMDEEWARAHRQAARQIRRQLTRMLLPYDRQQAAEEIDHVEYAIAGEPGASKPQDIDTDLAKQRAYAKRLRNDHQIDASVAQRSVGMWKPVEEQV